MNTVVTPALSPVGQGRTNYKPDKQMYGNKTALSHSCKIHVRQADYSLLFSNAEHISILLKLLALIAPSKHPLSRVFRAPQGVQDCLQSTTEQPSTGRANVNITLLGFLGFFAAYSRLFNHAAYAISSLVLG